MFLTYELKCDIIARAAAQLNWELKNKNCSVNIEFQNKVINAKSLIGLLSAGIRRGDVIRIRIDGSIDLDEIRECFNEVGQEI